MTSQSPDHVPLPCFISLYFVDATSICIHAISASLPFPRAYHGLHQCNLFMAILPRGVLYGGDLFGVVRWAPLLTSTSERRDRRSCVCDLKRKETWWRSHDSHLACSELRRPVLHGISWLAWDIVSDDVACNESYLAAFSLVLWWCGTGFLVESS